VARKQSKRTKWKGSASDENQCLQNAMKDVADHRSPFESGTLHVTKEEVIQGIEALSFVPFGKIISVFRNAPSLWLTLFVCASSVSSSSR
jgi:hypothetical protein